MRPALYTFLVGVAAIAFVGAVLLVVGVSAPSSVCLGSSTTGPNGGVTCTGGIGRFLSPEPTVDMDYR